MSQFSGVLSEWSQFPAYIRQATSSRLHGSYLEYLREMQWGGILIHRNTVWAKIIYSYPLFLANEMVELVEFAQPRLFFVTGDGSRFSPSSLQPIPVVLFPFWIAGLVYFVRTDRFRYFLWLFLLAAVAYLSGQKNLAFLFPILILYVYTAASGFAHLSLKFSSLILVLIVGYSLYTAIGSLWFGFR